MLELLLQWKRDGQFADGEDWIFASPAQSGRLPWSADAVNDAYLKAATAASAWSVHTQRGTPTDHGSMLSEPYRRSAEAGAARGHPYHDECLQGRGYQQVGSRQLESGQPGA